MKKIDKIQMRNAILLETEEMKRINGGSGGTGTGSGCYISCKAGSRDPDVTVKTCNDNVWPCGHGNSWSCTGC